MSEKNDIPVLPMLEGKHEEGLDTYKSQDTYISLINRRIVTAPTEPATSTIEPFLKLYELPLFCKSMIWKQTLMLLYAHMDDENFLQNASFVCKLGSVLSYDQVGVFTEQAEMDVALQFEVPEALWVCSLKMLQYQISAGNPKHTNYRTQYIKTLSCCKWAKENCMTIAGFWICAYNKRSAFTRSNNSCFHHLSVETQCNVHAWSTEKEKYLKSIQISAYIPGHQSNKCDSCVKMPPYSHRDQFSTTEYLASPCRHIYRPVPVLT